MTPLTLASLSELPQWVAWQTEIRQGSDKPTKVPYSPTGRRAKADDPSTWGVRSQAESQAARLTKPFRQGGIGLEFGPIVDDMWERSLGGIDLDTCLDKETGAIEPWALEVVKQFASYTEVSPSGTGVKLFFTYSPADLPALQRLMGTQHGKSFKRGTGDHPPAIELHLGHRYFATTEQLFDGTPHELRHVPAADIEWLLREAGPRFVGKPDMINGDFDMGPGVMAEDRTPRPEAPPPPSGPPPDAAALVDRLAEAMKRKRKLRDRWAGSTEGLQDSSRSGMDMSMMALLRRAKFTFEECKALLLRWPHGSGETKAGDDRHWWRLWERGAKPEEMREEEGQSSNRPRIRIVAGRIAEIVDEAEEALMNLVPRLYQRGEAIVTTGVVKVRIKDGKAPEVLHAIPVGEMAMVEKMTEAAAWEKFDARSEEWIPANAPKDMAKVYLQRIGSWRLPVLVGMVSAPTMRPDGTILSEPGYDEATGLLFDPQGTTFPTIPRAPSRDEALAALELLLDLIGTFPFVEETHRAVMISCMTTALVRRSLPAAPLHGFSAPAPGSGKSMLVDIMTCIATGQRAAVIAMGDKDEEFEKRLVAMMLAGDAFIPIDNCARPVGGDFLCQILTQAQVRGRVLGLSKTPLLISNAFVTANGNNLVLQGDMARRALLCRLDPQCERPEQREFERDPISMVRQDRGRYVAAALTILRAYHVAGRPPQAPPLGSFEEWSRMVRDALLWMGLPDPVSTMEEVRAADPKLQALGLVIAQWRLVLGDRRVTAAQVIEEAVKIQTLTTSDHALGQPGDKVFRHAEFYEALKAICEKGGKLDATTLGFWLRKNAERYVDGHVIRRDGEVHKTATWRVYATG